MNINKNLEYLDNNIIAYFDYLEIDLSFPIKIILCF